MRFGKLELVAVLMCAVVMMPPEVSATRWTVGGNQGWTTNVNYTVWAKDKHFYNGDWLCNFYSLSGISTPFFMFFRFRSARCRTSFCLSFLESTFLSLKRRF